MMNISQNRYFRVLTIAVLFVYLWLTYTTVTPLTVVRYMVKPGVPPNAGLLF
jgi:multisubunit Na+/H+ antiporter MnhE subunit